MSKNYYQAFYEKDCGTYPGFLKLYETLCLVGFDIYFQGL